MCRILPRIVHVNGIFCCLLLGNSLTFSLAVGGGENDDAPSQHDVESCAATTSTDGGSDKLCNSEAWENSVSSMGVPQILNGEEFGLPDTLIREVSDAALEYFREIDGMASGCRNEHELCVLWAAMGECQANPRFMKSSCGPVCRSCPDPTMFTTSAHVPDPCTVDPHAPHAWKSGDLDRTFQRLVSDDVYRSKYQIEVMSSPELTGGPWIVVIEEVVNQEEAERLIELGERHGFQSSTSSTDMEQNPSDEGRNSKHRTSYNTWCQNECYQDETARRVMDRLSNLTGIAETNSEYLQLIRYSPGQYYLPHHDFIPYEVDQPQGPRIMTVLLYLNEVESGGETEFPTLGLRVTPKVGRALLWPNVLNEDPTQIDPRTVHQALSVRTGQKYATNAWFHLRDAKTPNRLGCLASNRVVSD